MLTRGSRSSAIFKSIFKSKKRGSRNRGDQRRLPPRDLNGTSGLIWRNSTSTSGSKSSRASNGCASHRSYSQAEATDTPESPEATEDELDYALLRLTQTVGNSDAGGFPRGWANLPDHPVALPVGAPLLIVQHPDGAPLKLALDTNAIIGLNAAKTRIRYTTNTESGSSGSPCFNMDWQLVALHHYGDPAWHTAKFNQGVPAELIRRKIVADGFAALLGSAQRL